MSIEDFIVVLKDSGWRDICHTKFSTPAGRNGEIHLMATSPKGILHRVSYQLNERSIDLCYKDLVRTCQTWRPLNHRPSQWRKFHAKLKK